MVLGFFHSLFPEMRKCHHSFNSLFFLAGLKFVHKIIVINCKELVLWRASNGYQLGIACNFDEDIMYFTSQSYWLQKMLQLEWSLLLSWKKKSCAKYIKYLIYALVLMSTDSWLCFWGIPDCFLRKWKLSGIIGKYYRNRMTVMQLQHVFYSIVL